MGVGNFCFAFCYDDIVNASDLFSIIKVFIKNTSVQRAFVQSHIDCTDQIR